jgi:hypothetical protein
MDTMIQSQTKLADASYLGDRVAIRENGQERHAELGSTSNRIE